MAFPAHKSSGLRRSLRVLLVPAILFGVLTLVGVSIAVQIVPGSDRADTMTVGAVAFYVVAAIFMAWRLDDEAAPGWAYWAGILLASPPWLLMLSWLAYSYR